MYIHMTTVTPFESVVCPHENEKPVFSNSSTSKGSLEKLRILWKIKKNVDNRLTVAIKMCFQISPALCGHCLSYENYHNNQSKLPALVKSTNNFGRVAENRRVCLQK